MTLAYAGGWRVEEAQKCIWYTYKRDKKRVAIRILRFPLWLLGREGMKSLTMTVVRPTLSEY
jgi:hypothetical protein